MTLQSLSRPNHRASLVAAAAFALLAVGQAQAALIGVSDIGQPQVSSGGVGHGSWQAQSFVAGEDWALSSIDLRMGSAHDNSGGFLVELWSDNGGSPDASLVTLSGSTNTTPGCTNASSSLMPTTTLRARTTSGRIRAASNRRP